MSSLTPTYTCRRCGLQSTFQFFRTQQCLNCRRSKCRSLLDLLPEDLLGEIYEYAGGRPAHPSARIMSRLIAEAANRLMHAPCFFESPGVGSHENAEPPRLEAEEEGWTVGGFETTDDEMHPAETSAPAR